MQIQKSTMWQLSSLLKILHMKETAGWMHKFKKNIYFITVMPFWLKTLKQDKTFRTYVLFINMHIPIYI